MSAKKRKTGSLLTRLFTSGRHPADKSRKRDRKEAKESTRGPGAAHRAPAAQARPLTPRERSIAEAKQMARIGRRDPQRLAMLLAGMLAKERARQQQDRERFQARIDEILRRGRGSAAAPGDDRRDAGPRSPS